jgi:hypothetical protein
MKKKSNEQSRIIPANSVQGYFAKVLKLSNAGDTFPVNLDDVWPLGYGRKEEAVRALRETGIENADYQFLRRNAEQNPLSINGVSGGHNRVDYRISVPCLEWLIARKHRAVFEVYRKVFHRAIGNVSMRKADGHEGVDYADLLRSLGLSVRSGSFWKRIRKYPQEFRTENGAWYVSALMANVIGQQAQMRQTYVMLAEKRERYLTGQLELGFSSGTGASRKGACDF